MRLPLEDGNELHDETRLNNAHSNSREGVDI